MRLVCFALVVLLAAAGAQAKWVITAENGQGEDIKIDDLNAFLEFVQLGDDSYADIMEAEGMLVDDIKDITDEDLEAIGMTKRMHRKRFLRYAKEIRTSTASPKKQQQKEEKEGRKNKMKEAPAKRKEKAGKPAAGGADMTQADKDLVEALENEDPEGVEAAIESGANINAYYTVSGSDERMAPLMYVSLMGLVECAEVLLRHGPDFDLGMHGTDFSPIHGAAFQGQPEMVQALLDAGADKMDRHEDGFVPMHRACWGNTPKHTEAVLVFLNAGVDVLTSAKDPDQDGMMTPLEMSVSATTIGLLESWVETGKEPGGPMGDWAPASGVCETRSLFLLTTR